MKKTPLHYQISFLLIFLILGCSGGRNYRAQLKRADSLMTAHPDSAYTILTSIDSADIHKQRKAIRMRYELLRAEAQNKLYVPFTTDSVMRKVAAYYKSPWRKYILRSSHSASNEALKSLYLLGCVYRDLHEAPIALLTWEDAVAAADTTAVDCDYATLFRVYGQMAEMYMWQRFPEMELQSQRLFIKYALAAGDTLNYLRGKLHSNSAYFALGDTAAILSNIEDVRLQYLERGLVQEAARVYPSAIDIAVEIGQYERARKMMDEYELHSGLFDEKGNIVNSRIRYHYIKGLYYLGINAIDSAEFQFRKLLSDSLHLVDACRGLVKLYQFKHDADSAFKYGRLYEAALSRFLDNQNGEAIIQAQAMYNYQRQQQKAQAEEQKAKRWRIGGILATLITSILALIIYLYYIAAKEERNRKEQELRHVTDSYNLTLEHLNKAQAEALILQQSLSDKEALERLSEDKAEQVKQLEALVEDLHSQIDLLQDEPTRLSAKESKMVSQFQYIATSHNSKGDDGIITFIPGRCATSEEWDLMLEMFQECRPQLYVFLKEAQLTGNSMKICILSRYGFKNSDISTLTDLDIKYVSNARRKLAKETFHLRSAYELNKFLISKQ